MKWLELEISGPPEPPVAESSQVVAVPAGSEVLNLLEAPAKTLEIGGLLRAQVRPDRAWLVLLEVRPGGHDDHDGTDKICFAWRSRSAPPQDADAHYVGSTYTHGAWWHLFCRLVATLALLLVAGCAMAPPDVAGAPVVRVTCDDADRHGTATIVSDGLVTAGHVADGCASLTVYGPNGGNAVGIAWPQVRAARDLARLAVEWSGPHAAPSRFCPWSPRVGDAVELVAFPGYAQEAWTSFGWVSAADASGTAELWDRADWDGAVVHTALESEGSSGAPLLASGCPVAVHVGGAVGFGVALVPRDGEL